MATNPFWKFFSISVSVKNKLLTTFFRLFYIICRRQTLTFSYDGFTSVDEDAVFIIRLLLSGDFSGNSTLTTRGGRGQTGH